MNRYVLLVCKFPSGEWFIDQYFYAANDLHANFIARQKVFDDDFNYYRG